MMKERLPNTLDASWLANTKLVQGDTLSES
jgi:hypothetical protein